ncbi:MAG: acyl carrier protein [Aequorivita antarctica]
MDKQEIFKVIVSITAEVMPDIEAQNIAMGDRLADWAENSIDRLDIVVMTLESLSLNIPMMELATASTFGDLVDRIHAHI